MQTEITESPDLSPSRIAYEAHLRQRIASLREQLRALYEKHPDASHTLEIGCGHGHFLTAYAKQFPATFSLGVDLNIERIRKGEKKRQTLGLENLSFLRASIEDCMEALPEHLRFDSVFMLFPDPWPKKRHWKNRMLQTSFLSALVAKCNEGAHFHFRTDHEGLFEWALEHVDAHPNWKRLPEAQWPFEIETVFQSKAASHQSLIAEYVPTV